MADARAATPREHPEDRRQFCGQLLAELQDQTQLIATLTHERARPAGQGCRGRPGAGGHGILPGRPVENVKAVVDHVHATTARP